jgi:uncharacterized protein YndB with AHSA1/START domain
MNVQIRPAPVKKSVTVKAPQARAFDVFTRHMIRWWRPENHIGKAPLKDVVLEPKPGGRWYEVGTDGAACDWGKVLSWEPPRRIVLAWQLTAEWRFDPALITELEVRFVPEGDATRVELEHRNLERFGAKAQEMRGAFDSEAGWTGMLGTFLREVERGAPAA